MMELQRCWPSSIKCSSSGPAPCGGMETTHFNDWRTDVTVLTEHWPAQYSSTSCDHYKQRASIVLLQVKIVHPNIFGVPEPTRMMGWWTFFCCCCLCNSILFSVFLVTDGGVFVGGCSAYKLCLHVTVWAQTQKCRPCFRWFTQELLAFCPQKSLHSVKQHKHLP